MVACDNPEVRSHSVPANDWKLKNQAFDDSMGKAEKFYQFYFIGNTIPNQAQCFLSFPHFFSFFSRFRSFSVQVGMVSL
jgi:hypothetical protein